MPVVASAIGDRDRAAVVGVARVDGLAQVGEVADRAHGLDLAVVEQREAGRVIAAVLELLEPGDQEVAAGALAYISDDSAHAQASR